EHEVEHDEIVGVAQAGLGAGLAVADSVDAVTVSDEQVDDALAQARLVLDHQDVHGVIVPCRSWMPCKGHVSGRSYAGLTARRGGRAIVGTCTISRPRSGSPRAARSR